MKLILLIIAVACHASLATTTNSTSEEEKKIDWASPLIRSMGNVRRHSLPTQPFSFRTNCMRLQSWGLRVDKDYISVKCVWSYNMLRDKVFPELAAEVLPKHKHFVGVWTRASQYLQSNSFVAICQLHCTSGRPYPRLDGSEDYEPAEINVGCSSAFKMKCKEVCPESVFLVPHGKVSCSDGPFASSTCTASCNRGYTLRGPSKKKCNADGKEWLPREPFKCIPSLACPALPELRNGAYNCTASNNLFSRCEVSCGQGFTAPQPRVAWCGFDLHNVPQWMWMHSNKPEMVKSAAPQVGKPIECKSSNTEVLAVLRRLVLCNISPDYRRQCDARTQQRCESQGCCWHPMKDRRRPSCYYPSRASNNAADKSPSSGATAAASPSSPGKQMYGSAYGSTSNMFTNLASLYPLLMNKCGCGSGSVTSKGYASFTSPKIYRGKPKQVPWQAFIYFNNQLCGGTLITPNHVITAAHCVNPFDGSLDILKSNYVFLGLSNISDYGNRTQFRRIAAIERHFNFTQESNGYTHNDIAIIRLETPAKQASNVQPLCLPRRSLPTNNLECQISGYGQHTNFQSQPDLLNAAPVTLVPTYTCKKSYPNFPFLGKTICAGSQPGMQADTCSGDSGGPLACRVKSASSGQCNWFLMGITSFGKMPCGTAPSVYTNVAFYQGWIVQAITRLERKFRTARRSGWNFGR